MMFLAVVPIVAVVQATTWNHFHWIESTWSFSVILQARRFTNKKG
jgi:hypothetical protein